MDFNNIFKAHHEAKLACFIFLKEPALTPNLLA
jgi:hypothetical protein